MHKIVIVYTSFKIHEKIDWQPRFKCVNHLDKLF